MFVLLFYFFLILQTRDNAEKTVRGLVVDYDENLSIPNWVDPIEMGGVYVTKMTKVEWWQILQACKDKESELLGKKEKIKI